MKKVLFVLMATLAMTTISCQKNNNPGGEEEKTIAKPTYRVTKMMKGGADGDLYEFTWNSDGTIAKVNLAWNHEAYSSYVFTYSGSTCTVVDALSDNKPIATITLNDKKLATKIEQPAESEISKAKLVECSYDKNGFLTLAKVDGKVSTVQVIDEDGNIEWWGRVGIEEQITEQPTAKGWRKKMHTYYSQFNAAGIHGEWDEDVKVKRWFYETGLVGRASVSVMRTAWWYGVVNDDKTEVKQEYAARLAYYPLNVDANGCVTTELKLYDTKEKYESDPSTMGEDDKTEFVCEKI